MKKQIAILEIEKELKTFSLSEIKEIFHFIKFLKLKSEIDPTIEIIENNNFYDSVKTGLKQKSTGETVNWDKIK